MPGQIVPLEQARRTLEETRERAMARMEEIRTRRLGGSPAGIIPEIQRRVEKRMAIVRERRPLMGGGSVGGGGTSTSVSTGGEPPRERRVGIPEVIDVEV